MAHIPDGVLSPPVLIAGAALATAGTAHALRRLEPDDLPPVALLSAAFFVASLVQVPLGPSGAHLMLTGLMGLVLGWSAFPAVLVALILQLLMFGVGGLTSLGVNVMAMALPAAAVGVLLRPLLRRGQMAASLAGAAAGVAGVLMTGLLVALALAASGEAFVPAAKLVALAHLPLALVEGLVTAAAVRLLYRVRPSALPGVVPAHA